ncbi:MAG TPA: DUF167 domain-containing protein [Vicinamibacterales bacterium]
MITPTSGGVEIDVRLIPRSGRTELAGSRGGRLLVRVSAPPVEGAANEALIALMAKVLEVPKRAIRIVAGERSRQKRIAVAGIAAEDARRLVSAG